MQTRTVLALCLCASLLGAAGAAAANHVDISRLATQLNLASGQLAWELRSAGNYSSIRQRADHLSRESADLVAAVRGNRSDARVRAQFDDVRRRYENLEEALLRATRKRYDPFLFAELDHISSLYSELSQEFYYSGRYGAPPAIRFSSPVVVQRYIAPRVFRGQVYGGQSWREQSQRDDRHQAQQRDRRDYGRIQVQRLPRFDHRSPVQERQARLDNRRNPVEASRRTHSESSRRTDTETSRRTNTETARRNHYE